MNKIGILTFCNANNLGAALQAYSLQKKTEEIGLESELIDYRCPAIEAMHAPRRWNVKKRLKTNLQGLISNFVFKRRRKMFQRFRQLMIISRPYFPDTISQSNAEYGAFITGSDQVFNLKLTKGDKAFFLDFVEPGKKKIAFAASVGEYVEEEKETYKRLLSRFDYLSVREPSSAALLKEKTGIDCQVIPDPVFLHTAGEWEKLLGLQRKEQGYVLVYSLHNLRELYQFANHLARGKGIKVIAVTKHVFPAGKADTVNRCASPKDFLDLMLNADYVVTDSFHGTAFSLIFRKQFFVFLPTKYQDRIVDLLNEVGLQERIVSDVAIRPEDIGYDGFETALDQYAYKAEKAIQELKEIC